MQRAFWRRLSVRIGAAALLIVAVGVSTALVTGSIDTAQTRLDAHDQRAALRVQEQGTQVLLDLVDMETGLRGYILTGDASFLAPYQSGERDLRRELATLGSEHQDVEAVRQGAQVWQERFAAPSLAMASGGGAAAAKVRSVAWQAYGKSLFDALRGRVNVFLARAQQGAARRIAARAAAGRTAREETTALAVVMQLVVLVVAGLLLAEGTRAVIRLSRALRRRDQGRLATLTGGPAEIVALAEEIEAFAQEAAAERLQLQTEVAAAALSAQEAKVESAAQVRLAQLRAEFLANMSHELRTPLNSVIGFADLLLSRGGLNERQERYARYILESGHHLLQLVNDLLDMARIDAGRLELQIRECDAGHVAHEAVASVVPQMEAKHLACTVHVEGPSVCLADPDRLRQAILNLLSNAYKFTDPGGTVEVSVRRPNGSVEVAVRDTGHGIPPDRLEDIFDEFVQVSQGVSRASEGTGLGLALSRRLVRLMDGEITVASTLAEGSTFTIHLLAPEQLRWPETAEHRVLVAEDDSASRHFIAVALEELDVVLRWASSGAMLHALMREALPDLLILDILLPDGNGLEMLEELAERDVMCPVIVVSVVEPPAPLPPGVLRWLRKPYAVADLQKAIHSALLKGDG